MFAAPYAASKAGVEALGRALRSELSVTGASASVAHFGFIDTEMVRQGFDTERPPHEQFAETFPGFMRKRLPPSEAARGVVDGIEKRAPAHHRPALVGRVVRAARMLNPVFDRAMERQEQYQSILREADTLDRADRPGGPDHAGERRRRSRKPLAAVESRPGL